jgi:hypothetical protein
MAPRYCMQPLGRRRYRNSRRPIVIYTIRLGAAYKAIQPKCPELHAAGGPTVACSGSDPAVTDVTTTWGVIIKRRATKT